MLVERAESFATRDQQLNRSKLRERSPYNHWKLTDENGRNHERWEAYEKFGHAVLQISSTRNVRWIVSAGGNSD